MTFWGRRGGSTKCHCILFSSFETLSFVSYEEKRFVGTSFLLNFTLQSILGIKMKYYEKKNVTKGVCVSEKCHVLIKRLLKIYSKKLRKNM